MSPVPSPNPSSNAGHGRSKEKHMWKVDTFAPHNDGHQWRKYGEKKINNSNFPRYYYRCTYKDNMNCPATKQIQQKEYNDPPLYSVTYHNEHTCNGAFTPIVADLLNQHSTGRAVSICFDSYGIQEPRATVCSASSSMPQHCMPLPSKNQPISVCSEVYSCGVESAEQKPACFEIMAGSIVCDDVISSDLVPQELSGAGQSRSIRYYHFL